MEIKRGQQPDGVELRLAGRLDASWAEYLDKELAEVVQGGERRIRLQMADVPYLSSAGIRVLIKWRKAVAAINGSLVVAEPSEFVRDVLEMSGLKQYLSVEPPPEAGVPPPEPERRSLDTETLKLTPFACDAGGGLTCRLIGAPERLAGPGYSARDVRSLEIGSTVSALGLGAFGVGFSEVEMRFGEFLALAGASAIQPTGKDSAPDYMLGAASFVPEINVLYSLACEGKYSTLVRFGPKFGATTVTLAALAKIALRTVDAPAVGVALVAECVGLIGAGLKRSPVQDGTDHRLFDYPGIQDWLSFTSEHASERSLAVVVGVVAAEAAGRRARFLRPLSAVAGPVGHFHAASFTHKSLPEGKINLSETVRGVFETQKLLGVLHLLRDDREATNARDSEFARGAMWVSPVRHWVEVTG